MVTREHTQFEHHLMEREAAMAPNPEAYLQAVRKLKQQNEIVSDNITKMEAQEKEMQLEGGDSKQEAKVLSLQLVEAKDKLVAMAQLKQASEGGREELRLKVGQATKRVEQSEKALAEKEAEACALGLKLGELKLKPKSARIGCMDASEKEAEANALRVKVGELELELKSVGKGIVDANGSDAGSRFAVLQETLRETKGTGARLTEQLSVAREALRTTKWKSRGACEALQTALDEALPNADRLANKAGWEGVGSSGSVSADVCDGGPGSRAPHLAAVRATGEALLVQVGVQLKHAKTTL